MLIIMKMCDLSEIKQDTITGVVAIIDQVGIIIVRVVAITVTVEPTIDLTDLSIIDRFYIRCIFANVSRIIRLSLRLSFFDSPRLSSNSYLTSHD